MGRIVNMELTENEVEFLLIACGSAYMIPPVVSDSGAPPASGKTIMPRLARALSGTDSPAPSAPAPAIPTPASPPAANAGDQTAAIIRPFEVKKVGNGNKEHLWIKWKVGNVTNSANCWKDKQALWPRLLNSVNHSIGVIVEEKNGYLNIVGVK